MTNPPQSSNWRLVSSLQTWSHQWTKCVRRSNQGQRTNKRLILTRHSSSKTWTSKSSSWLRHQMGLRQAVITQFISMRLFTKASEWTSLSLTSTWHLNRQNVASSKQWTTSKTRRSITKKSTLMAFQLVGSSKVYRLNLSRTRRNQLDQKWQLLSSNQAFSISTQFSKKTHLSKQLV